VARAHSSGKWSKAARRPENKADEMFENKEFQPIAVALQKFVTSVGEHVSSLKINLAGISLAETHDEDAVKQARTQLEGHGASLALDATKLTLALAKPPFEAVVVNHIIKSMQQTIDAMVFFVSAGPSGKQASEKWRSTVEDVLEGLVGVLAQNGWISSEHSKQGSIHISQGTVYQRTGLVWESCNVFKQLPLSNRDACSELIKEQHEILKDVVREVQVLAEELMNETAGADIISMRELVKNTKGIIKLLEMVVNKIYARLIPSITYSDDLAGEIDGFLDNVVEQVSLIQTVVDDVVCALQELAEDAASEEHSIDSIILAIRTELAPKCQILIQSCTVMPGLDTDVHDAWFEMAKKQLSVGLDKLCALQNPRRQT